MTSVNDEENVKTVPMQSYAGHYELMLCIYNTNSLSILGFQLAIWL